MTHLCMWHDSFAPLTEEIRLKIFGSPYWTVFPSTLLSDGDFRLLPWKPVWNYVDSRENLFESYGDSRENLFEILAVVNIWSLISSARGAGCHGTHLCVWCMSESCPKYESVMSHQPTVYEWNAGCYSLVCVTWLIHMCDMTHSYFFWTWLIHMCGMTDLHAWHDLRICGTWLIHNGCHDSFIGVIRLFHECSMTHLYVGHDSFICATWRIHMCDMTHSYVWHDSYICATWLIHV